jgi:hypothetical protein
VIRDDTTKIVKSEHRQTQTDKRKLNIFKLFLKKKPG